MKKIPLTKGMFALVDDADYEWLNQWKWYAMKVRNTFYAVRGCCQSGKYELILMHREILKALPNEKTDHRNHNGLDNQRGNLRTCTNTTNQYNQQPQKGRSSQFKGVSWHKSHLKWEAYIMKDSKNYHLGHYVSEIDAAKAYDKAAIKYFGEFAYLNLA